MTATSSARRVIIRKCDEYDADVISGIIREGIEELGERPRGRILIKPNVVTANKEYIHHSYTNPTVIESMVKILKTHYNAGNNITIGESGGIGIPTRLFFADSGYRKLAKQIGVHLSYPSNLPTPSKICQNHKKSTTTA